MSDKQNNLNPDSDITKVDNDTENIEKKPSVQAPKNKVTAPLQLPDKISTLLPLPDESEEEDTQFRAPKISTNSKLDKPEISDKSVDIPFEEKKKAEADPKDKTYARRPSFDIVEDKSILTFNKKKDATLRRKSPDTAILPDDSASWRKVIDGQAQGTTATLGEQREVLFVIRGMIERVVMQDNSSVTLGRFDTGTVMNEEIDLIPYGAIDRGVSRRHCKIQLQNNQLYVTDLQSTNGTFLAGIRLKPNEQTVLRKGDEVLLGRLAVQVLFR